MHNHSLTALFTVIYVKQSDAIAICNWQYPFSPLLQAENPRQYLKQMKMKTCYSNRRSLEVNNVTVVFCAEMYNTVIFWIVTTIKIKHQLASFSGSFENDQAVHLEMASNTVFCLWVPIACGWHEICRSVDSELHVKCWTLTVRHALFKQHLGGWPSFYDTQDVHIIMCYSTKVGTFQSNNLLEFRHPQYVLAVKSSSITQPSVIHYVHAHAYKTAANQLAIPIQCGLLYKIIIKQPSPNINTTHCLMTECMHGLDSNWSLKSFFVSSFLISSFPVPNITNPSQKCRAYAISGGVGFEY